jgi:hypothetical protein
MSATTASPETHAPACAPAELNDELTEQLWEEHGWSMTGRQTAVILLAVLAISAVCALVG